MKAGVSTACLYPKLLEESLYDLTLNGVANVEIFVNTHSEIKKSFAIGLKDTLNRFDANCLSLHPYTCEIETMMIFSGYDRRIKDTMDYMKYYFEFMNIIGAKIFVLHGSKGPDNFSRELYAERYSMLYNMGKEFGITVAVENVSRCLSGSLRFLKDLSSILGDDIKFVLDTKQAVRSGENVFDMINSLGNKIIHVHLSDSGELGDCLLLGKGRMDINKFISKLYENSPDSNVIIELYRNNFSGISDLINNYNVIDRIISKLNN